MSGVTVFTNKDKALKDIAEEHFTQLEAVNLLGKHEVKDHDSKIEWSFENVFDAIMATDYLCNHFEYCHRF